MRKLVNRHRYVLKCDISNFFEGIDHEILVARLGHAVRCPGFMCRVSWMGSCGG